MSHISFSELKAWATCAYYHKLLYIDRKGLFKGNEYTAFGKALHDVAEHSANCLKDNKDSGDLPLLFKTNFLDQLLSLKEKDVELNKDLIQSMKDQGAFIADKIIPALEDYFEDYEIISAEYKLFEPIEEYSNKVYSFKGFIDLVVKTADGKHHIIDWKTCSWGWDARKRSDPLLTYQLTLYKKYYSQKFDLDPRSVETHFALLKRTAKKEHVEFFRVTSGPKKTQNAFNLMKKALYNIDKKLYVKNRTACSNCEFYKTEHCT